MIKRRPLVADSILDLIGFTPLLKLKRLPAADAAEVVVKLESFNPCWSVKDRIGAAMIEDAERKGLIAPGRTTIVEPTSGNTGIGLAMAAAAKGYRAILVMPETMTQERRRVLLAFGATIVLTPAAKGIKGSIAKAQALLAETPGGWMPSQFDNPANPEVHRGSTALEILEDTGGRLDAFVAGVGTGGTITGVGSVLKERVPGVRVVAVESADQPLLSGGQPVRGNRIQGISPGFVPGNYDAKLVDRVVVVPFEDAVATARRLCREEGVFAGISAGANVRAALDLALELGPGKRVVVIVPDLGERYLSHDLYAAAVDPAQIVDATKEL
jgi:cysteine synthase A